MSEIIFFGEPTSAKSTQQGITGLSSLLLYSVISYFVGKIKDAFTSGILHIPQPQDSAFQIYCRWLLRLFVEWSKAMAVILCVRDRGISFELDFNYTLITFSYYISTERLFVDMFITLISYAKLSCFDCMEHLYIPIILNTYVLISGIIITIYMLPGKHAMYAMFASYFVIYLRMKDIYYNYINTLMLEKKTFASFRSATDDDIQRWDDICAVCLNKMSRAKITPCNHLFHPACLKHCLRTSLQCPLCKQDFLQ